MRKTFYSEFLKQDAILLYNDVGFGVIETDNPRCINVGIAEQVMIGMAAGIASQGKKVYCYSIAPHLVRAWEFVRNLLVYKGYDVTLIAVGVGSDYESLGHSHVIYPRELRALCEAISLSYYAPDSAEAIKDTLKIQGPKLIHLSKRILQ